MCILFSFSFFFFFLSSVNVHNCTPEQTPICENHGEFFQLLDMNLFAYSFGGSYSYSYSYSWFFPWEITVQEWAKCWKKQKILLNHHSCFKQSFQIKIFFFPQLFPFLIFKHCDSFSSQVPLTSDLVYTTPKTPPNIFSNFAVTPTFTKGLLAPAATFLLYNVQLCRIWSACCFMRFICQHRWNLNFLGSVP